MKKLIFASVIFTLTGYLCASDFESREQLISKLKEMGYQEKNNKYYKFYYYNNENVSLELTSITKVFGAWTTNVRENYTKTVGGTVEQQKAALIEKYIG